ncbi:uncharacterized protein LOC113584872 isoform X1 [Electrophorus electricus]|uniref:uncharacterized protein LOC113584872 isoform X1 n=1 Tax=Electrophorus electricus TaxID=8005 RepID=UPI0015D0B0D1|nr:uncharacterized protein LOC113584872 isoform X1 [Electrophorus electricus]
MAGRWKTQTRVCSAPHAPRQTGSACTKGFGSARPALENYAPAPAETTLLHRWRFYSPNCLIRTKVPRHQRHGWDRGRAHASGTRAKQGGVFRTEELCDVFRTEELCDVFRTEGPYGVFRTEGLCDVFRTGELCGVFRTGELCGVFRTEGLCDVFRTEELCGVFRTEELWSGSALPALCSLGAGAEVTSTAEQVGGNGQRSEKKMTGSGGNAAITEQVKCQRRGTNLNKASSQMLLQQQG